LLNPETVLQLALPEQEGRQTRPELTPMQSALRLTVLSAHESPGKFVAPRSGGAQTQMSCAGAGALTVATRHVEEPPQLASTQHVSMHVFGVPAQSPERHSLLFAHATPPIFAPGTLRCASVAGTQ
jgi:hypothetical protein